MLHAARIGLWKLDIATGKAVVSDTELALYGHPPGAPFDFPDWLSRVHPADRARVEVETRSAVEAGTSYNSEFRIIRADTGEVRWIYAMGRRLDDTVFGGANLDITDRKNTEFRLRESESRLARAIAAGQISTWEWDMASDALHVSPGFDALFGRPPGSLRTMTATLDMVHAADLGKVTAAIERALHSGDDSNHEAEFRIVWPDGTIRFLWAQGRVERGGAGEPLRLLGVTHDITERKRAEERIAYLAHYDPLTGLGNRVMFRQHLERALDSYDGRAGTMALHWIDFDQFKGVNDTLGHPAGDALLREAAGRLQRCVSERAVVARVSGDEFAVIQTGLCTPLDAAFLARRIIGAFDEPYEIEGRQVSVGASIGIAIAPGDGMTADEIVKKADIALYRAKAEGRGMFRLFAPEMNQAVQRKQELIAGLRTALARGEMELHFQPLVGLRSDEVTCFEALLRWRHPVHGLVPTLDFITVAEESGLIVPIGAWALRMACHEAARWPAPIRVAVNLSPVQFRGPGPLRAVTDALAEAGLAPERLELEITESVLLQDDEANLAILHQLRHLGVRIVLDDFGTGYSSLGYLRRFPFGKIKIDRSFVSDIPDQAESNAIVRAVIGLGRDLGIAIAAEGVETARQLGILRGNGCDEAQGYYFGHPVPAAEVPVVVGRLARWHPPLGIASRLPGADRG